MTPRAVVHLLGSAARAGTAPAAMVADLARGLDPARYHLRAWFTAGDGPLRGELEGLGVETRVVPWSGGWKDAAGALRFARACRGARVALVHQHYGGRSMRLLARRLTGTPLLLHWHARIGVETGTPTPLALDARGADRVVANSRATAACVRGATAAVVYPGVHVPAEPPPPRTGDEFVVGFAGRLVPLKGVDVLLRAVALIAGELPRLRLEIAGDGPENGMLRRLARELGIGERVAFAGWRTDLTDVRRGWDVAVQPSREEAFGVAAAEAMASGLPVVASAAGGLPELVVEGETGYLVGPGDPEALAGRLRALACDPALRRAMGSAGHARVRAHFSSAGFVRAIEGHYDALLGACGRR
jgi:glycosyltransferase involved in cell wall biosynthesis